MKKLRIILITCVLYFFVYTVQVVILHAFINPIVTPLMLTRTVEGLFDGGPARGIQKKWVSIQHISPNMVKAVMASEDQKFLEHNGFDWEAINKAIQYNKKKKGKKMRGASTISQQTAKNVFLWPSRMWIRKGAEAYFTCLIELFWSKKRIMEVYLNVIETGDGMYGVEVASEKYFKKTASNLNKTESACIAAILPLPLKWSPVKPNSRVNGRIFWIRNQIGSIATPPWFLH